MNLHQQLSLLRRRETVIHSLWRIHASLRIHTLKVNCPVWSAPKYRLIHGISALQPIAPTPTHFYKINRSPLWKHQRKIIHFTHHISRLQWYLRNICMWTTSIFSWNLIKLIFREQMLMRWEKYWRNKENRGRKKGKKRTEATLLPYWKS